MRRGELYWVNLNPTVGSEIQKIRPCVILSASPINKARRTVVIIPLTSSTKQHPPITVEVLCMNKKALAVCDQIKAVDKSRLTQKIGLLSKDDMKKIEQGLRQVLCLY